MYEKANPVAVAENQALLRCILESSMDAIIVIDADGFILSFSGAAARIFGYTEAEVLGKSSKLLMPDPNVSQHVESVPDVIDAEQKNAQDVRRRLTGIRKSGETFPIEVAVGQAAVSDRHLSTLIVRDISGALMNEKALAEMTALHSVILDTVLDAIVTVDLKGVILSLNKATERIFGYADRAMLGRDVRMLLPAHRHAKHAASALNAVINLGREVEGQRRNGQIFPIEVDVVEAKLEGRQIFTCIVRDMTKRQEAEREMLLFRNLVEYTDDPVYVLNPRKNYQMVYTNAAGLKHFGYAADQLYAMHESDWDVNYDQGKMDELWRRLQSGECALFEAEHKSASGEFIPVEISCNYLRHGDEEYWAGHFRNITERRRVDRMKKEFISTVSHELRTPLTSIRGSLGLISGVMAGSLPTQTKKMIDIAYNNSERLVRLINDILDMEKIEAGRMQFNLQPYRLRDLLDQAMEANRSYGEQYDVRFELDWQAQDDVQVLVDTDRFMQVMANLLSNAAKFSPKGGQVEVSARMATSDAISIGVTDHGAGIPLEFRERIFQKFSQADSSSAHTKGGTGLGLSIAKAIVEQLGGQLGYETELGQGTTMQFTLPLPQTAAARVQADLTPFLGHA